MKSTWLESGSECNFCIDCSWIDDGSVEVQGGHVTIFYLVCLYIPLSCTRGSDRVSLQEELSPWSASIYREVEINQGKHVSFEYTGPSIKYIILRSSYGLTIRLMDKWWWWYMRELIVPQGHLSSYRLCTHAGLTSLPISCDN